MGRRSLRAAAHVCDEPRLEDCVVIDLIGRASLPIDLFTLDTGLLFPETYALKRQIEERYGVTIRGP